MFHLLIVLVGLSCISISATYSYNHYLDDMLLTLTHLNQPKSMMISPYFIVDLIIVTFHSNWILKQSKFSRFNSNHLPCNFILKGFTHKFSSNRNSYQKFIYVLNLYNGTKILRFLLMHCNPSHKIRFNDT